MSRAAAVLACRAESSRLYGKPLQVVGDRPVLDHLLDRLQQVSGIAEIGLAISDTPSRDVFIDLARRRGLRYVVGPEDDVLGRLIACAELLQADHIVRVTTENPYVYWENVNDMLAAHRQQGAAITVTVDLPVGAAIEIVSPAAHRAAHARGTARHRQSPSEFLVEHDTEFKVQRLPAPPAVRAPELRVTIDSPEDLQLARALYAALHRDGQLIAVADIVSLLRSRPDLVALNAAHRAPYLWHGTGQVAR